MTARVLGVLGVLFTLAGLLVMVTLDPGQNIAREWLTGMLCVVFGVGCCLSAGAMYARNATPPARGHTLYRRGDLWSDK